MNKKVSIKKKFMKFHEYWSPKVIAELNDYQFKIVKIKGDFIWHKHDKTDEVFIVIEGTMKLQFRDGIVELEKGDLYVVPKGIEHKPSSVDEC